MELRTLSNAELVNSFGKIVQTERKITHLVLECISEIDIRKIYLERAYPSLFEFLTKVFGYSPSAAVRRIESARLLREVPEIAVKIEEGSLNLSQLSQVQQAIRITQKQESRKIPTDEKRQLLKKIENTTQNHRRKRKNPPKRIRHPNNHFLKKTNSNSRKSIKFDVTCFAKSKMGRCYDRFSCERNCTKN